MSLDQSKLTDYAWERLNQAVTTGQLKLESGKVVILDDDQLVRLLQWLAGLAPRRKKRVTPPEDFAPPVTGSK